MVEIELDVGMQTVPNVLIAEDDEGHAILVQQTLRDAGLGNTIQHFKDGQAILDFLFRRGNGPHRQEDQPYVLLLDIRMPKVNGVEVLQQLKANPDLRKLPIIMLTTTDDPREVLRCHELGCSVYIQKPVDYDKFSEAIRRLGLFIMLLLVPPVNGRP
ncbi:MAG: response regulator receiver protein [Verrucomicrobia bacterium]|jgi:CheY-like chemotaxis protein|nr:response regulator receiver protein [Verrucomicrobiota bacterium]